MSIKNLVSNIIGTDGKEQIKKVVAKFKNRGFKPYVVDRTLYGTDFKFYVADKEVESWYVTSSAESIAEKGEWVWKEMEFVKNFICTEGDIVLECGGHHGLTAVVIAEWIGEKGHIYSFEPNPENVAIIKKNLEVNHTQNVDIIPDAVGAEPGKLMITNSSSNSYILKGKEHNGVEVNVATADSYIHVKPTVLKIDVEGFETEVLKGAVKLLKTFPKLVIELHPDRITRYGSSVEELLSLIDPAYKLWVQWDIDKDPLPYDRTVPINDRAHIFGIKE